MFSSNRLVNAPLTDSHDLSNPFYSTALVSEKLYLEVPHVGSDSLYTLSEFLLADFKRAGKAGRV